MGESVSAEEVEALTMVEATKLALGRATHLLPTDAGVVALWSTGEMKWHEGQVSESD